LVATVSTTRISAQDHRPVTCLGDAQIRVILAAIVFAQTNNIRIIPRRKDPVDDVLQPGLRRIVRLD
jgi:hypothetical protein